MNRTHDLIVIGAGMAGVAAANKCAAQGWQVAIVDALPYGGTCALRGCDPKKILRRGAEIIDSARLMRGKGIDDAGLSINWPDLMKHKHGFTDPVPQNMEDGLTGNGVTTLHGHARFTGPRQLEIDGDRLRRRPLPGRHRRPTPPPGVPGPRAPDRQHRLPGPRGPPVADPVRRRRVHLLRVRPHRRPGRQLAGHRRPRRASAEELRPRSRRAPGRPRPRGRRRPAPHHHHRGRAAVRSAATRSPSTTPAPRRRSRPTSSSTAPDASRTSPTWVSTPPASQWGERGVQRRRPPAEHHEPGRLGRRGLGRHRRHAAHPGRGLRSQGRRLEHDQGHHHRPGLRGHPHRGLHHPRARPRRHARGRGRASTESTWPSATPTPAAGTPTTGSGRRPQP